MAAIDTARLSSVFVNLISNALEAMIGIGEDPSKFTTAAPRITVSTSRPARGVDVVVADNGPGIPPDVLGNVLEPLFTTKSFGARLGIPAAVKVLQDHNGGLDIQSAPGAGVRFTAWFPLQQPINQAA